jgi:acyl carrier protein
MENIDDFTQRFKEQYFDSETISITPDSDFRQVDSWDSLTGMAVLVMIKEKYEKDLTVETFRNLKTVRDVYNYVISIKNK